MRSYNYWNVVADTGVITQHISSILIFIAVFLYLYVGRLSPEVLLTSCALTMATGYAIWDFSIRSMYSSYTMKRRHIIKSSVLFCIILFGLSPVLKTLTEDTTSDTIWALSAGLFLGNCLLYDYSVSPHTLLKLPGVIATNAAVFASVVLASRLPTNIHVFSFLTFAVAWFALFPMFRRLLNSSSEFHKIALTLALVVLATASFSQYSKLVIYLYFATTLFITFVCPLWLIWIQRYKNQINGPWDEALPKISEE